MLSRLRKLLENWIARIFFTLLILVFLFWGISNVVTLIGNNSAVAHLGGKAIDISVVQAEYQKELTQAMQGNPTQPDLAARQRIAQGAMTTVLRQQALSREEEQLGVAVPDSAVRQNLYGVPAFQTNGVFDKAKFDQVLQQNNLSPDQFLALVKQDLAGSQVVQALVSGATSPQELNDLIFAFVSEQRMAETVSIPVAGGPAPPAPAGAVLQRYWRNHAAQFTAPEYRTVEVVVLSPQALAPQEPVSDAEISAMYAQVSNQRSVPASRSVQVVTASDAGSAAKLASLWRIGANWAQIQAAAAKAGASAVELDHARQDQFPSSALANAVFAAPVDSVSGPVQGPLGYFVLKVTDAVAGGAPPLSQVSSQIKQAIQLQKAQADVNQDVDNVQDALAGQTPLDKLPGDLGLVAVEGTLDANGNTVDGSPAPIPGGANLRNAIVKAVFAGHIGDPAQLITGPDGGYFAFTVESITPPALQPYAKVEQKVAAAWLQDALTREAEVKAATLLNAVNNGESLDAAASAAGYSIIMTPPVTRNAPPSGISNEMVQILFSLKLGQATMQQTDSGFTVAALSAINQPKPAEDPADADEVAQSMTKSLQNDVAASFIAGLQARDHVRVDDKLFAQIYQ
jgi:peptidyl-prolyl cis-trans isomerase D